MTETTPVKISIVYVFNSIDWKRTDYYDKETYGSVFAIVGEYDEDEEGNPEEPNFGLKNDPRAACLVEFADPKTANTVAAGVTQLLRCLGHDVQQRAWGED